MLTSGELTYDVSSALSQGRRNRQEDAIAADFPVGTGQGFAVVADGMGGHAAGDVASQIVVTEMFGELKMLFQTQTDLEQNIRSVLREATKEVNSCIALYSQHNPETNFMGATLLAPLLFSERLYWVSVGDSPLFLFRNGELTRLNEDHSMAPQIDLMYRQRLINIEQAKNHPDRNCLTSVLVGREIAKIDCSGKPVRLRQDDIVVAASDGLQFLNDRRIAEILKTYQNRPSIEISAALLRDLEELDDPMQDNVSLCVIKPIGLEAVQEHIPCQVSPKIVEQTAEGRHEPSSVTVLLRKKRGGTNTYCYSKKVRP